MAEFKQELICDDISEEIISITERLAMTEGAHNVNVKKIISDMGVTNRVFYNRFHNSDEVLRIVYENAVEKMHSTIDLNIVSKENLLGYCMDAAEKVLTDTYDIKMQFSRYMFEHDSITESNKKWWMKEIRKNVEYAKSMDMIRDNIDIDTLCYSVWCFCRAFSVDAVSRKLPKEEAVKVFRFSFGCFLRGLLK
ncbi:MAG: TetR/AcrR family transcriptional regulator [Ruminococcus sp.]